MNRFTRFLNSMHRRDRLALIQSAEIHKLETASRVIRQMIHRGEYKGVMMCVVVYTSPALNHEEKMLTTDVITHHLIDNMNSLTMYLYSRKPKLNGQLGPISQDYEFLRHALNCGDEFTRRVVLSDWYLKQCDLLDQRVRQLRNEILC